MRFKKNLVKDKFICFFEWSEEGHRTQRLQSEEVAILSGPLDYFEPTIFPIEHERLIIVNYRKKIGQNKGWNFELLWFFNNFTHQNL